MTTPATNGASRTPGPSEGQRPSTTTRCECLEHPGCKNEVVDRSFDPPLCTPCLFTCEQVEVPITQETRDLADSVRISGRLLTLLNAPKGGLPHGYRRAP